MIEKENQTRKEITMGVVTDDNGFPITDGNGNPITDEDENTSDNQISKKGGTEKDVEKSRI